MPGSYPQSFWLNWVVYTLDIGIFECSSDVPVMIPQIAPKLGGLKQPFPYVHRFCGSEIQTEQSRYDFSSTVWVLLFEDQKSEGVDIWRLDRVERPRWLTQHSWQWILMCSQGWESQVQFINEPSVEVQGHTLSFGLFCCFDCDHVLITINFLQINVGKPHKISLNIYLIKVTDGTFIGPSCAGGVYYFEREASKAK